MKPSKKIPKTFISFLIISFFIWLLITFSKEYTAVITFPVTYKNIAQNKLLQETPIKEIDLSIKASGFKIVSTQIRKKTINLEASSLKKKKGNSYYFLPKDQLLKIQKQLLSGLDLKEIIQDTIYLNIGQLSSKKVPLIPNLDLNYHIGFDILDKIKLEPDSVVISGPESQINKIKNLQLNKLTLKDIKSNFNQDVNILKPKGLENIKLSFSKSTISGNVDKFTEGSLRIPFTIMNLPDNINLTILNEDVEVVFVVALSNFSKVSEASFNIECDYGMSEKNNLNYLLPKVTLKPNFIKSIKVVPIKIDFLIQR